ncbi:MAG: hypothetical protein V4558_15935 [Gemmatimonadota bacterium]
MTPSTWLARAGAAIGVRIKSVERSQADSAGWQILRFSWVEDDTDFIHPESMQVWIRRVGARLLVLGMMDPELQARGDAFEFVSSMRVSGP